MSIDDHHLPLALAHWLEAADDAPVRVSIRDRAGDPGDVVAVLDGAARHVAYDGDGWLTEWDLARGLLLLNGGDLLRALEVLAGTARLMYHDAPF